MLLQRDVGRSCGGCTGCCKPFPVPEIGKSHCGWCPHSKKDKGCAIYKDRPEACRKYACLWLNGKGEDGYRPDRMGVVLDVRDLKLSTRAVGVLHIFEIRRFALEQDVIKQVIELNKDAGLIVIQYRMDGPKNYKNTAQWRIDHFSETEEQEIRAHLSKNDPSAV